MDARPGGGPGRRRPADRVRGVGDVGRPAAGRPPRVHPVGPGRARVILLGIAVVLAACAVGVLRGHRGFAVAAAGLVVLITGFLGPTALALVNATTIGLLTWANARLRGPVDEAGRAARRDPVVLAASTGCAAAAVATLAWIGIWVWQDDVLHPEFEEWFSPLVRIVTRTVPALLLVAAAAGTARGSVAWAAVAGPDRPRRRPGHPGGRGRRRDHGPGSRDPGPAGRRGSRDRPAPPARRPRRRRNPSGNRGLRKTATAAATGPSMCPRCPAGG